MALTALIAFSISGVETSVVALEMYRMASSPTLLTIPLFTLAGYLIAESKAPQRLYRLADSALGHLPGGVSIVALVVCAFFTAFTGASGVTIIALGGLLYPILKAEGYSEKFSLGLLTTSGSLGLLFPPSLPIILYGLIAKVDIDDLFKAGIFPGILLLAVLSLWSIINAPKKTEKSHRKKFSLNKFYQAFIASFFEAILPFLVLFGIYGGLVTPTEAASLTAFYILIVECFIYKDLNIVKDVPKIIIESMSLVGGILLILCCALAVTNFLIDEEVPTHILEFMRRFLDNKYSFLLFLNIFLLIVGSLMDIFSAIIVVVPLIIPIANEFGIHPVHLAMIFLTNLEIGYITPPVGINLFISSYRFKKSITQLYGSTLPYLFLLLFCLIIITYIPAISLFWE